MTEPVDIPAAYKARYGLGNKIGPEPVFSPTQAEPVDGRDNKRVLYFENHRRGGP